MSPDAPFVDFYRLDRDAFALLGLTPRGVDRLSFRDLWAMMAGAREREKMQWQHTAVIVQAIMNHGGNGLKQPKPLLHLYTQMFGGVSNTSRPDQKRMRSLLSGISKRKEQ